MIIQRDVAPYGTSWEDWTIRWWRWILSIEKSKNPGLDSSGEKFDPNQGHPNVIFLVGTFEGYAERYYDIPEKKAILLPVINFITSFIEEPDLKTEQQLVSRAKEDIDSMVRKRLTIDGTGLTDIEKYRVRSRAFDLTFPEDNIFGFRPGITKAISDGYWIFLKPLSHGRHTIYASGSCYSGKTTESITWHLHVNNESKI
jgi:hypothetical protein